MASFKALLLVVFPLYQYHIILLLLLFTSSPHSTKLIFADEKLIEQQCHNADVPATCLRCLTSNPQGQKTNKLEIATIVINCISTNAKTLASNMSSLASGVHYKNLKFVFRACTKGFGEAKRDLSTATKELKSKDYDQTNYFVRMALEQVIICKRNINVSMEISRLPCNILDDMRVYEELSNAAMRIIDRF